MSPLLCNLELSTNGITISEPPSFDKFVINLEIISLTTRKMFWPILYTVLTTIIAFLSLIFSEIKPVIDFGLMMTFGLIISFIITLLGSHLFLETPL